MHFSKRNALVVALCSALLYVGATSAGAATIGTDASYKAADTNPVPPLTPDQQKTLDQKRQAAADLLARTSGNTTVHAKAAVVSTAGASTVSASGSYALSKNQNPQKRIYWCGPASVNEALGQMGKWFTQAALADELGTTTAGTGWLNGSSGPVPRVMNRHQSRRDYFGTPVPGSPSSWDVGYFKLGLLTNIPLIGAPLIGDAWEVHDGKRLVGHPNPGVGKAIFHWFDIYGYQNGGATTVYEDSVHDAPGIGWAGTVPAYSTLPTSTIVQIVGGRGYVW